MGPASFSFTHGQILYRRAHTSLSSKTAKPSKNISAHFFFLLISGVASFFFFSLFLSCRCESAALCGSAIRPRTHTHTQKLRERERLDYSTGYVFIFIMSKKLDDNICKKKGKFLSSLDIRVPNRTISYIPPTLRHAFISIKGYI